MLKRIYRFEIDRETAREYHSVVYDARDQLDDSAVLLYEWAPDAADATAVDRFSQVMPSLADVEAFTSETHFYLATKSREQALAPLQTLRAQRLFTGLWPGIAAPAPPPVTPPPVTPPPTPTPQPPPIKPPVKPATGGGKVIWASLAVILAIGGVLGYVSYQRSQEEAERVRKEKAREEQVRKDRLREETAKKAKRSKQSPVVNIEKKKTFDELFPTLVTPPSLAPVVPVAKLLAVCVQNPTNVDIVYQFSWSGQSETHALKKGESRVYEASFRPLLEFRIDFDNNFAAGYTGTRLVLPSNEMDAPANCDKARQYYFSTKGQQIGLVARTWTPGFNHPFAANVVQSSTKEGSWVPASGYRWFNPKDPADLNVVPSDAGLIGVAIAKDDKSPFCKISSVRPDGPAAKVNLRAGWEIRRIGGVIASGWTVDQCKAAIRGPINSTVSLEVYDPSLNMIYTVNVLRQ